MTALSFSTTTRKRPIELAQAVAYGLMGVLGYLKAYIPYLNSSKKEETGTAGVEVPPPRSPRAPPSPRGSIVAAEPVTVAVPVFPSLFDVASDAGGMVGGRHEDALLEAIETWPQSRISVLHQVRDVLRQYVEASQRSGRLPTIVDIFDNIREVGGGAYGKVYVACLRGHSRGHCRTFTLDIPGFSSPTVATVYLAVKQIRRVYDLPGRAVHENMAHGKYVGNVNVMREVLLGRFLNYLVQARVTPHLPFVYEAFNAAPSPTTSIAMELCHLDFHAFLNKILPQIADAVLRQKMLYVALLQLAHALACAQARLDFRHNDLHSKNAMMTFITNGTYTYSVRGRLYAVPNFGMCWKITDFGFGSSAYLFDRDDSLVALRHTRAAQAVPVRVRHKSHAVEMTDFLRLLHSARRSMEAGNLRNEVQMCNTIEDSIHALALGRPELAGSLHLFFDLSSVPHGVDVEEMSKSHGLMTELFMYLASPFHVRSDGGTATGGVPNSVVYDIEAPLFGEGLTGIERRYYILQSGGRLRRKIE